jgi:ribonuclease E
VIDQIENRLKVSIVILPSRHLETPAYDIERIKEKEGTDEKPSYLQIKAEEITVPEFAQQIKHPIEKAAVREFLHDSPAPAQNRNEAASLIKRFWTKLVACVGVETPEPETSTVAEVVSIPVVEKTPVAQENRNRNNNNRRDKHKNRERNNNNQEQSTQNQELRPNRPVRGPGRNVRPNLPPVVPVVEAEAPVSAAFPIPVSEVTRNVPHEAKVESELTDIVASESDTLPPKPERKNNNRRGPNRRRPRNPNYKKPEADAESPVFHSDESPNLERYEASEPRQHTLVRSYNSEFAERIEKIERAESPVPAPMVESAPKMEISRTETDTE